MKIMHGYELMEMDEKTGNISRPAIGMKASGDWKVYGAVRRNNFGHVVTRVSFPDIVAGAIKDWQHKNGAQKWFVRDIDHGTMREWTCRHSIY